MITRTTERLLDLKARQEADQHMNCPRCGRNTLKHPINTNALSRSCGLYICDECGTQEALRAVMKNPLPVNLWACMHFENPFQADSIPEYLPAIQEHIPFLEQLFLECMQSLEQEDFAAYRYEAQVHCPGVTQLWTDPFMVEYQAKDGTRALIRFRMKDGTPEYAIDTFEK